MTHAFIGFGDMPFLLPQTPPLIIRAIDKSVSIIVPTYEGQRGHPVLFQAMHFANLKKLDGDKGGRSIITACPNVLDFAVNDEGVCLDIDTQEAFDRMTAMLLPIWFFITAALYATVGFGGGSTYTALIAMTDMPVWRIPIVALACNIVVVALGSYLAVRRRAFDWRDASPFFIASVPMAFIGGLIPLRDDVYISLLAGSLILAGARLLFINDIDTPPNALQQNRTKALFIGGGLGLLSAWWVSAVGFF